MNRDLGLVLFLIGMFLTIALLDTYSWKECVKDHPAWYCIRILGK